MATADPPQSSPSAAGAPERDPYEADESELAEGAPDANDLDALRARADMPGLLALAKACRAGTAAAGRDMKRCLEAYRAAAELGSAEAEYAVALFYMNGGSIVAQDLKEGAMRLRSAAEKGSVPAKVYLGNLYELGIHYKADAEKADVWYRNAGRGAKVEAAPGSDEYSRALADLGCARHALVLTRGPGLDEEDKKRLLARAKAHGHGLRMRDEASAPDRASGVDPLPGADSAPSMPEELRAKADPPKGPVAGAAGAVTPAGPAEEGARGGKTEEAGKAQAAKRKSAERSARVSAAMVAFGYAFLFALAGAGAGYAAMLGARELVAHGHVLPVLGTKTRFVFPIVLGVVGVLPAWLAYKIGAVLKALFVGAAVGGIGWVAWGTGQAVFHGDRPLQALAFALAGFLAALFVLGFLGGAKQPRAATRSR